VATYEKGAVNGIYDLAGNVWEWTSSPYMPYEKYKPLKIKTKGRRSVLRVEAGFDPNMRVLVSGSFKQSKDGVRIPTRMPTARNQSAEALGFRVAASTVPGLDLAQELIKNTLDFRAMPGDIEFLERASLVKQRWITSPGSVKVDGYRVITGHEQMLLCPVAKIEVNNKSSLEKLSITEPVRIGFLSLSKTLAEPLLDGGTYILGWRAANKLPNLEKDETAPDWTRVDGFVAEADNYFLYSIDGTPQVAFPAPPVIQGRLQPGSIKLEPYVPPKETEVDEDAPPPPPPVETLRYSFTVAGKRKTSSFRFDLPIKLRPGTIDASWQ
jgi:hypothetical protein